MSSLSPSISPLLLLKKIFSIFSAMKWFFLFQFFCFALFSKVVPVYVITVPKSGTHLMLKLIYLLQHEGELPLRGRIAHFYIGNKEFDYARVAKYKKIIFLRNLRDVVVSFTHYMIKLGPYQNIVDEGEDSEHFYYELHTFEERLSFILRPGNSFHEFLMKNCEGCVKAMQNPDILTLRFEDLVGEKGGGNEEAQRRCIENALQFMSFELPQDQLSEIQLKLFGDTHTFRKGQIGSWREEFTPEQSLLFDRSFGSVNRQLGYD